jgi:DNA-binding NarL/FixJ family response regulator
MSIGRSRENGLALEDDSAASRVHAAIRRIGASWCLRDLGSANGTFVNGQRLQGERALETGDEVLIGKTALVFRSSDQKSGDMTESGPDKPDLTPREKDVLVALCKPALSADLFTEPASVREISGSLFITEAAVKQHLGHLYRKFGIHDEDRRRTRLANEAFMRGSVSMADLND